jgi:hypothetical protein
MDAPGFNEGALVAIDDIYNSYMPYMPSFKLMET